MQERGLNFIVYDPGRLIYVLGPKLGSTGTVDLFVRLAGIETAQGSVRGAAEEAMATGRFAAEGVQFLRGYHRRLRELRAAYPDYALFANIRDPYARILSNYYSKMNRYAARFAPGVFRYGKLHQVLKGPGRWTDNRHGNKAMHRRIPFLEMLRGLERHGIDFDPHFNLQSVVLDLADTPYDRLFRIETLDDELLPALAGRGVAPALLARVSGLNRRNQSAYDRDVGALFTPEACAIIERLYARDFDALGYPRRTA